jgi:exodeoxyribonuclease V alpha subunit
MKSPSLLETYLSKDSAFFGIGPKRAETLFQAFGDNVLEKLKTPSEDVISIIGEEAALCAASVLELRSAESKLIEWLNGYTHTLPLPHILRISRAWGETGVDAIKDNPYLLLSISSWNAIDKLSQSVGVPRKDIRRQMGAIEAVLQGPHGLEGGHTLVPDYIIREKASNLLGFPLSKQAVDKCLSSGGAIRTAEGFQPPGAAWMEAEVEGALLRLAIETPHSSKNTDYFHKHTQTSTIALTAMQSKAVDLSQKYRLFVLGGYAGSGKTTTLRAICDAFEASQRTPLIVTLSGKAAQRAHEATGRESMTLAKFFILHDKDNGFLRDDHVLIVDEASMLSLPDMWRIIRRIGNASLLLCGDPAQLSPIGFGLVFHKLFDIPSIPCVVLNQVMRQSSESGIPDFAKSVRNGILPPLSKPDDTLQGISFTPSKRDDICIHIVSSMSSCLKAGFQKEDIQILAPTKREISTINSYFHQKFVDKNTEKWGRYKSICVGEPIIWTQNDPDRNLTNGSVGYLIEAGYTPKALLDGTVIDLKPEDEMFIELAHAISIHKAQGSQWPCVIVPIFPTKLLDRSLIYTAITRSENHVLLLGDKKSLEKSINIQSSLMRKTMLLS